MTADCLGCARAASGIAAAPARPAMNSRRLMVPNLRYDQRIRPDQCLEAADVGSASFSADPAVLSAG